MMPAVSTDPARPHHPILGFAFKLISVLFLSGMIACVKYLGTGIPSGQAIFFRGVIAMPVLAVIAARSTGLSVLKTRNWRAHAARSIAGSVSMFGWFISLTMIPLARMTAISFTVPLFLTVLAIPFLGERIHWYRWTALGVGFAGVAVIVGPQLKGAGGSALGTGIALGAAVTAAFAQMFLRRMSREEHALTITFYFFATSTALAVLTAAFVRWPWPTPGQWLVLGLIGVFGVFGQLTLSYAFRYAEASVVAPLEYLSLLSSVTIGFYVFGEVPSVWTWIGVPLVIAAGGTILWREYTKLKAIPSAEQIAP